MRCLLLGPALALAACSTPEETPTFVPTAESAEFAGRETCARCHAEENRLWLGSDHDRAMEVPDEQSVLGDFDDAVFEKDGVRTTFFRRDERYWVRTDGADGELGEFEISYTFGFEPLQQYLVAFPGGRLQALGVAWDSRPATHGGQRWFHLYPDETIPAGDVLHWTGPNQNWNYMCAECHSTDLRKGYSAGEDRYQTTWREIDVSCEACHGPGSHHVAWGQARERGEDLDYGKAMGLVLRPGDNARDASWNIDPATGKATRTPSLATRNEVETCGRCHSRRSVQVDEYEYDVPLTDTHRVSLLAPGLYHADGQILDEVYVYGSFLQSRMYAKGVTCSDCHEPHQLGVMVDGNGLCNRCHLAARFDSPEHSFHPVGTEGSRCVECHMSTRDYMVVDPRLDHSMRVPRPDLSVRLGTPNACNDCHDDQSAEWAAERVAQWYGRDRRQEWHYGEALHAARLRSPEAADLLVRLANDWEQPGIARATALSLLEQYPNPRSIEAIARAVGNDDPLIRLGALMSLRHSDAQTIMLLAYPLLRDGNRSVRLQAARVLTAIPLEQLPTAERETVIAAIEELLAALRVNGDRAEFQVNIGIVLAQSGRADEAEAAYRRAIALAPRQIPARVNLADLYRAQGRDAEGEQLLRQALDFEPDSADVHHAVGLLLVRRKRAQEALDELGRASALDPGHARYGLAYALALKSQGDYASATQVLRRALAASPYSVEILFALVDISRETADTAAALDYARQLVALQPQDPALRNLVRELEQQQ